MKATEVLTPGDPLTASIYGLTTVHSPFGCANHKPVSVCGCDENVVCRTCGYGHGQIPCKCERDHPDTEGGQDG